MIVPEVFHFHFGGTNLPSPPPGVTTMIVMCRKSMHVAYQMKALESRNQNVPNFQNETTVGCTARQNGLRN